MRKLIYILYGMLVGLVSLSAGLFVYGGMI